MNIAPAGTPGLTHIALNLADAYPRRKMTSVLAIVFTDVAKSTDILESLGEVEYQRLKEGHEELVRSRVESEDSGSVVQFLGDGCLAVFAEPSTAVIKCLRLQQTMRDHPHFRLRVGVDMGQVSVGLRGPIVEDVFGRQVNRAARIQALAEPGHTLTSYGVYDCAVGWLRAEGIRWQDQGPAHLKGFQDVTYLFEPLDSTTGSAQRISDDSRVLVRGECKPVEERDIDSLRRNLRRAVIDFPAREYPDTMFMCLPRPQILWVDDAPENNEFERSVLLEAGCEVRLSPSTEDALAKLAAKKYQLLITDMHWPESPIAGLELLREMKRRSLLPTVSGWREPEKTAAIVYTSCRNAFEYGSEIREIGASLCTAGLHSLLHGIFTLICGRRHPPRATQPGKGRG